MKFTAVKVAALLLSSSYAMPLLACEVNDRFVESLEHPMRAFVGTVAGYRMNDTSLASSAPECPYAYDDERQSQECVSFWDRVVSIQYEVEVAIGGIEPDRKYETTVWNLDGCVPRIGERWLTSGWYGDGFSMRLDAIPSQEQIDEWRTINRSDEMR
jgi:hypothetical protein